MTHTSTRTPCIHPLFVLLVLTSCTGPNPELLGARSTGADEGVTDGTDESTASEAGDGHGTSMEPQADDDGQDGQDGESAESETGGGSGEPLEADSSESDGSDSSDESPEPMDLPSDEVCVDVDLEVPPDCLACLELSCCVELTACIVDQDCMCLTDCVFNGQDTLACALECALEDLELPALTVALDECATLACIDSCGATRG